MLDHFAVLKGVAGTRRAQRDVVEALLQQVNLWDVRKRKLGTASPAACASASASPRRCSATRS